MKFVLFSVVCLFAVVLAKPALKQKRDILPGDPRYGTDYHHHHHHHHENEVEVSKALGGYVGSYTVQENSDPYQNIIDFQAPQQAYGPPGHTPGKPIHHPTPQVGHVPAPTVHHYQQQGSEQVKYNNQYLAPATESHHVQYTTPQVHYTTPAPYYTTAVPHYSHAVPNYRPSVEVHNDYLPPDHGHQKSVEGPVTSYGTPVPDYQIPEVQPTVEHHDHHVAHEKATVLGEVSTTHVQAVTAAPVHHEEEVVQEVHHEEEIVQDAPEQQEVQTYEAPIQTKVETYHHEAPVQQEQVHHYHHEAPVQQEVVHQTHHHEAPVASHSHTETHTHVQPAVHSVKTVKEQVTHVQHSVQPTLHHSVQPAVHRVVQQTVHQPAVHHQTYYQQPQVAQTYSNNYFGSGFDNFGTDSGFESTYGTPNFQVSRVVPQVYNHDFSNTGFGYQDTSNIFTQHVQQPTYQVPQHSVIRTPQINLNRYVQPQQVTSFVQNQVLPQFPSYHESTQQVVQQPSVSTKSTQLVDPNNGGYVY